MPMLYVIQNGFNDVKAIHPEEIIYCVLTVELIQKHNLDFIFTNGHATNRFSKFYDKSNLDKIKENPELKTKILTFYGDIMCEDIKNIINIKEDISNILNYEKLDDDVLFKSMNYLNIFLSTIMSFFADVYLLGRMFKDFDMFGYVDETEYDQMYDLYHKQLTNNKNIYDLVYGF
jgi:hypothetical protein